MSSELMATIYLFTLKLFVLEITIKFKYEQVYKLGSGTGLERGIPIIPHSR
jgi:hypothetical protein